MKIVAPLLLYVTIFLSCIGLAAIPSCGGIDCKDPANAGKAKCVVEQAAVDCTTKTAQDFIAQHAGDVSKFFTPDGVDWTAVEQALVNLVAPEAICVLETVVEHYLSSTPSPVPDDASTPIPAPDDAGTVASKLGARGDVHGIRAKADALRAKLWPGKSARLR